MRIISKRTLCDFYQRHPDAEQPLKAWHERVIQATWLSGQDINNEFGNQVALITGDRARFKIKGNHYRVVVAIDYARSWVFIKFVGTHAEYDKIDAATVSLFT